MINNPKLIKIVLEKIKKIKKEELDKAFDQIKKESEDNNMCEYCEKRIKNKKILDIDNETETHMEIINQKKSWGYMLYVEIEGVDNDGYKPSQFFQISYCPMCRTKTGRKWTKINRKLGDDKR